LSRSGTGDNLDRSTRRGGKSPSMSRAGTSDNLDRSSPPGTDYNNTRTTWRSSGTDRKSRSSAADTRSQGTEQLDHRSSVGGGTTGRSWAKTTSSRSPRDAKTVTESEARTPGNRSRRSRSRSMASMSVGNLFDVKTTAHKRRGSTNDLRAGAGAQTTTTGNQFVDKMVHKAAMTRIRRRASTTGFDRRLSTATEFNLEAMKNLLYDVSEEEEAWCGDITPPKSKLQIAQAHYAALREEARLKEEEKRRQEEEERRKKNVGKSEEELKREEDQEIDEILRKRTKEVESILDYPIGNGREFKPYSAKRVINKKKITRIQWMDEDREMMFLNNVPHFFNSEYARQ